MKPKLLLLSTLLVTLAVNVIASPASAESGGDGALDTICVYGETLPGSDCLNLGPAGTLTDLAKIGMTFPLRPLPAVKPDASLTNVDVALAKVNIDKTERCMYAPSRLQSQAIIRLVQSLLVLPATYPLLMLPTSMTMPMYTCALEFGRVPPRLLTPISRA